MTVLKRAISVNVGQSQAELTTFDDGYITPLPITSELVCPSQKRAHRQAKKIENRPSDYVPTGALSGYEDPDQAYLEDSAGSDCENVCPSC